MTNKYPVVNGYKIEPRADLQGANLQGANLQGADLGGSDLCGADLQGANLGGAYLCVAYLEGANLGGANLRRAYLVGANLEGAYLRGANLRGANLEGAYLCESNVSDTILDPFRRPNGRCSEFEQHATRSGQVWCKGYRTANSPIIGGDGYKAGRWYSAPYFSTCPHTACHPGLYVRPAAEAGDIGVWFFDHACHEVECKWRVTDFWVEE
jgi:hypothetical protein